MGPLIVNDIISPNTNMLLAFFIGIAFGFILESSGFSSSRKLVGVFYGYDTVVLKVFFTGAITAMLGLLFFSLFGWMDLTYIYINPTYLWSTLVGGVIMGAGFILGGFCPGTSVCAAAIGKIDAFLFIAGIFIGIFIFMEGYPLWEGLYKAEFLGYLKMNKYFNLSSGLFVLLVIAAAVVMFWIAEKAEKKFKAPEY
ncbi:MAG: YeeE/YedE family protein [Bacteroidales bacterium]|nr:YeeE/YedE family protein [Bacteroidales bacterium]MCF8343232.1 YeeE/YedE family protein [Bacteroidales bacterium]MCF8350865.1 YeeE/YedE family protein [Bacteroidales bacterium]MCF8374859.1 YeeE/YedE family protein [Bacteroidales bacterium]MCF8399737.1 YeeE/YedE family protein [Bacteroidales bacterium]